MKVSKKIALRAGRILKESGEKAKEEFLQQYKSTIFSDFGPPVKCNIIALSRPLNEWKLSKAGISIQNYIYSMSENEFNRLLPGSSKASHTKWFDTHPSLSIFSDLQVQALNCIFNNSINTRKGCFVKVDNRNKKRAAKQVSIELESAIDEFGYLKQKPNANPTIFGFQGMTPFVPKNDFLTKIGFDNEKCFNSLDTIIHTNRNYLTRIQIPEGMPGHIPEWQYSLLSSKNKRMRNRNGLPILVCIKHDIDWALIDIRSLLRSVYWRHPDTRGRITVKSLLDFFTKDVQLTYRNGKNICTFFYDQDKVGIENKKIIKRKASRKEILNIVQGEPACLVSIDLGQTNIASMRFSIISNEMIAKHCASEFLPSNLITALKHVRTLTDRLECKITDQAFFLLTEEQKNEISSYKNDIANKCKKYLISLLGLNSCELKWDEMSSNTYFIYEFVKNNLDKKQSKIFIDAINDHELRNSKTKLILKSSDFAYGRNIRHCLPKISKETSSKFEEIKWQLKIKSDDYKKISQTKLECSRRIANYIVQRGKYLTNLSKILVSVEDLNMNGGFFDGKGKKDPGWNNLFYHKKENKFFMKAMHKALTDLAQHKGITVFEVSPERTSITCTNCKYCSADNRIGEHFKCLKCGVILNADLDVAAANIELVTLSGQAMPCERPYGEQLAGPSRMG